MSYRLHRRDRFRLRAICCVALLAIVAALQSSTTLAAQGIPSADPTVRSISDYYPPSSIMSQDSSEESGTELEFITLDDSPTSAAQELFGEEFPSPASQCSVSRSGEKLCIDFEEGAEYVAEAERLVTQASDDLVPWCNEPSTQNRILRFEACLKGHSPLVVTISVEDVPVGQARWAMKQEMVVDYLSREIKQSITLIPMAPDFMDPALVNVTLAWNPLETCLFDCSGRQQSWDGSLTWTPGDFHIARGEFTMDWDGQATKSILHGWTMAAYSIAAPNDVAVTGWATDPPLEVRCDDEISTQRPGCVFSQYTPSMVYSMSGPYPELARHIGMAVEYGMPNPRRNALTRLVDPLLQRRNGDRACKASYPRPEGKSCDEFPFRSTYEGAYTSDPDGAKGLKALELPVNICHIRVEDPADPWGGNIGYTVCMINEEQNTRGGRALQTFYYQNRVIDGDPFYVNLTH